MAIATRTPATVMVERLRTDEQFQQQVAAALPETVRPERFLRAAQTAVLENPDLAKAGEALFLPVLRCAQDGLLPDGREAAIVFFGNKPVYLPMIGGLRKIAGEYGWTLTTRVVYANDTFEHALGSEEKIVHIPVRPGEERGQLVAAYAIASHRDRRKSEIAVMYRQDIEKIKATSRAAASGPWKDWEERMWEKSVGRYLFKRLALDQLDERVARIIAAAELDPDDSVAAMYGPQARGALTPDPQPAPADVEGNLRTQTPDGRQAGDAALASPHASPAPDSDEDEPLPPEDEDTAALAESAGRVKVPPRTRSYAGQTIAEVHALGTPHSQEWLGWALDSRRSWNKDDSENSIFGEALRVYVQHYLPEVWTAFAGSES